jgi:beta-glucosidase
MTTYTDLRFPQGFLWGCATAAHQVEGNNTNNNWWEWEQEGGHIKGNDVSGLACDHYNRFDSDFALAQELGHNAHRLSVEWSRIEPEEGRWDMKEVDHYRKVMESLHRHGLVPMVTLHHFTNPIWFQRQGGWTNPRSVDLIARFSGFIARELGDLVPYWFTINEPMVIVVASYIAAEHPPRQTDWSTAMTVSRHLLQAHGAMYRAVKESTTHNPLVGPVHNMPYFEPYDPDSEEDRDATRGADLAMNEYFLAGIDTGTVGPPVGQGEEAPGLKGTWDFIGVNYYSRHRIAHDRPIDPAGLPPPGAELTEMGYEVFPEGFYRQLVRLKKYGLPVYVTENGLSTKDDSQRCRHLLRHLAVMHRAMQEGTDMRGYLHWTLIDNFEWAEGYQQWFGMMAMEPGTLKRLPRPSAYLFRDIARGNAVTAAMLKEHLG